MNKLFNRYIAAVSLLCSTTMAVADNELAVHVSYDENIALGMSLILDGQTVKKITNTGLVYFDLGEGGHSIQVVKEGNTVHSFRFESAAGQLADINIALSSTENPKELIESYNKIEAVGQRIKAKKGVVNGRVTANGLPVVGANVETKGGRYNEETDENGYYQLEIPRGIYTLVIDHPDLGSEQIKDFRIISNVTKGANIRLGRLAQQVIEEVTVVARFNSSAFQESERYSAGVIDTLGVEDIARFGDSDIAGSVLRMPAVTIQDSKHIFIRGMGGRYITTTLNGATMPSTDPNMRTVPLDLFPSNIVEQLDVKKTFIASMPGESTGGNLVINTRKFPDDVAGKLSVSLGGVLGLTTSHVASDSHSGDWDFSGWDDGTRGESAVVESITQALKYNDHFSEKTEIQLRRIAGLELSDNLDLDSTRVNPDVSIGLNYGDVLDVGDESELGYFFAVNYKNNWDQKSEGIRRSYSVEGTDIEDDFKFEEYINVIEASALLSLGLNVGDSTYESNTVLSRVTENKVRQSEGIDGDALEPSNKYSIEWVERQFISQQFSGEHIFGEDSNIVNNWQITVSQAERIAPDRREIKFNQTNPNSFFRLEVPELTRRFDELSDDNLDLSNNLEYIFGADGNLEHTLSAGLQVISRERDSDSSTYGYNGGRNDPTLDLSPNLLVSDVINTANITGDTATGYAFQDKTLASDSYEAEMDLNSVFINYDVLLGGVVQVITGLRYEDYEQITKTFSLEGEQNSVQSEINEDIILPSISVNWFVDDEQQLRFAVSQTVSRPDFKETSNATFYDPEFDFRVRGNPLLNVSEIINIDLRWEKYFSDTESVSVALFYKDIQDPIERVVLRASGTASNSRTYENSKSAEIYGIELDGRKEFSLNESLTKSVFVAMNASFIDSEVEQENGSTRPLQGQPEYTFNLIVGWDDLENNQELTLLFNQSGESIKDVGVSGRDDVIEEPRMDVKLNYKWSFSDEWVVKAKLDNLLNSEVEFTQGGRVFQRYEKGPEIHIGVDRNF